DLSNLNAIYKQASRWGLEPSDSFRPAFPPSLNEIAKDLPQEMLVNPSTQIPVEYYPGARDSDVNRPVLVSRGADGWNVVFSAGQGRWIDDGTPEAEELDRQLAAIKGEEFLGRHGGDAAGSAGLVVGALAYADTDSRSAMVTEKPRSSQQAAETKELQQTGGRREARARPAQPVDRAESPAEELAAAEREEVPRDSLQRITVSAPSSFVRAESPEIGAGYIDSVVLDVKNTGRRRGAGRSEEGSSLMKARANMDALLPSSGLKDIHDDSSEVQKEEISVKTDLSRRVKSARVQRLANVRDFQRSWGVAADSDQAQAAPPMPTAAPRQQAGPAASDEAQAAPSPLMKPEPSAPAPMARAVGVHPFVETATEPFSTFAMDVDTASYTLSRNHLLRGALPPPESVRTEEFVNYFNYQYTPPRNAAFAIHTDCGPSVFGRGLAMLKIGIKARRLNREEQRRSMITLLVDTSGSMATPDRIGLAREMLKRMVANLHPQDRVAIVQYDSRARLVLEHTLAAEQTRIVEALDNLQTSGSTDLAQGMRQAYAAAARAFEGAAVNHVMLFSDGMANLGATDAAAILASVAEYRKQGITLSVYGLGHGSYNDAMLEQLANKGDGSYVFIDSLEEARRVLTDQPGEALSLIAGDAKVQVEFNPRRVWSYRQLGYENRRLQKQQFRDDSVDAGEVGSGQSVTALYELDLIREAPHEPLGIVRIRFRNAETGFIEEIERILDGSRAGRDFRAMDARFRLAVAVAHFAEILRGSPYAAGSRLEDVARVLQPVAAELSLDAQVAELLRLTQSGLTPNFTVNE
ncbi:MAG: von Willebrand factor type A domain-containing protein, partial [Lentisphaerae bacterium]|nr:von Willebrand factor type A domain-containing protein [Lentisphaerota bacterium]